MCPKYHGHIHVTVSRLRNCGELLEAVYKHVML